MRVSLHTLAEQCFGIDDAQRCSRWWCRLHPWVLQRISQRTGVSVTRLRRMTFDSYEPVYREDEDNERFAGRRYHEAPPTWRAYRFAVCGQCLEEDEAPYLRLPWLLGWMAVCPRHGTILIVRCDRCRAKCHVAHLGSAATFSPTTCTRCGTGLLNGNYTTASPAVVKLQAALFKGKCDGVTELEGLGRLTWNEMVALADVLLGMFWTTRTMDETLDDYDRYRLAILDEPADTVGVYNGRYASLRLLAWLTEGWPHSTGSQLGRDLLGSWLRGGVKNRISAHIKEGGRHWSLRPDDFEPGIRKRLRALLC